jgi:hypothetical protein
MSKLEIWNKEEGGHKEMSSILADQKRSRMWAQMRGKGEGVAGPQPMSTAVHVEPK